MKLRYRKLAALLSVTLLGNLCLCDDVITACAQEIPVETTVGWQETTENREGAWNETRETLSEDAGMNADMEESEDAEGTEQTKEAESDASKAVSENLEKAGEQEIPVTTDGRTITRQGNITESGSAKWSLDTAGLLMLEGTIGQDEYYEWDLLREYDDEFEIVEDYRDEVKAIVNKLSGDRHGFFCSSFSQYNNLESIDLSNADLNQIDDTCIDFEGCEKLKSITFGTEKITALTDMSSMFYGCSSLTSVNLSSFSTANVTDMRSMFYGCSSLANVDLSGFNTANVTDMSSMFYGCSSLAGVNLSSFNTANVTDMSSMFYGCSSLANVNLSGFNTANVTNMRSMFDGCSSLTGVNLSSFSTANVTDMSAMFYGCSSLANVDLSSFSTANVTDMSAMFSGCSSLANVNLSSFNTANVTNMRYMFDRCSSLANVDLSGFNTANVTDLFGMFDECNTLEELDLRSFSFASYNAETDPEFLFYDCVSMKKLMLPANVPFEMSLPFEYYWIDNQDTVCRETKKNANEAMTYTQVGSIEGHDILTGGRSGSIIWVLDSFGTLSLFGDGNYAMDGTWNGQPVPKWCEYNSNIEEVVVKTAGLTTAQNMLTGCTKLYSITLPAGLKVSVAFPEITGWYWVDGSNARCTESKINTGAQETYSLIPEPAQTPSVPGTSTQGSAQTPSAPGTSTQGSAQTPSVPQTSTPETKPLKKGSGFTDAKTKLKYKVTDASVSRPAVSCTGTANSKAAKISIPATVEYQGIKYTVTGIGAKAFKGNKKITSVTIGASVTAVGNSAFDGCTSLKSVVVGKSAKTIGSTVFKNCKNLKKITVKSTVLTKVGKNALKGVHKSCVIKVPKAQLKKYKSLFKGKGQKSVKVK